MPFYTVYSHHFYMKSSLLIVEVMLKSAAVAQRDHTLTNGGGKQIIVLIAVLSSCSSVQYPISTTLLTLPMHNIPTIAVSTFAWLFFLLPVALSTLVVISQGTICVRGWFAPGPWGLQRPNRMVNEDGERSSDQLIKYNEMQHTKLYINGAGIDTRQIVW